MNDEALAVHHIDHLTAITRSTKPCRAYVTDTAIDEDPLHAFMLSKLPQQYDLSKELFYCIPESARIEFIKNRRQLLGQGQNKSTDTNTKTNQETNRNS